MPLIHQFDAAMAALGPFEPAPRLAVGVSGGADSTALALLSDAWTRARGGSVLGLVVDHGLRAESATEARQTISRLQTLGIPARHLTVTDLARGSGMAERARDARYHILTKACRAAGIVHLLLGHHAADQAETMMLRVLSGSHERGLAAMPAVTEHDAIRLLRPLLTVPPALLRDYLREQGIDWVEDPSNQDPSAARARMRRLSAINPETTSVLTAATRLAGRERAGQDAKIAAVLAERVTIRPEGFALLTPGAIMPEALAILIRVIAGSAFPPGIDQVAPLAAHLAPATLWGTRLLPAGRLGPGLWLLVREGAAMAPAMTAAHGIIWDRRFRLVVTGRLPERVVIGALGDAAARTRRHSRLPAAVLRTLPALWCGDALMAVPHLAYPTTIACEGIQCVFHPPQPLIGAPFFPA